MATPMEQAVVELQILVRQLRKQMSWLEWRTGLQADPPVPPEKADPGFAPLKSREQMIPKVTHVSGENVEPYDVAPPKGGAGGKAGAGGVVAMEQGAGGFAENVRVPMSSMAGRGDVPRGEVPAADVAPADVAPAGDVGAEGVAKEAAAGAAEAGVPPVENQAVGAEAAAAVPEGPPAPPPYETVPMPEGERARTAVWDTDRLYTPAEVREAAAAAARVALEKTIGEKVTVWTGTLVLIAGMLFFIDTAWREDWQTAMIRVWFTVLDGLAMVAVGEWLHFRKVRPLSAAVAAIGVAVMMGGIFAGNAAFAVPAIPFGGALVATVGVGIFGILVARQMGYESMAVLSVLGMYLAPLILKNHVNDDRNFLWYVLIVTLGGLAMRWVRRPWVLVRVAAFCCGWAWMLNWADSPFAWMNATLGAGIVAAFFALFLLDIAVSLPYLRGLADKYRTAKTKFLYDAHPDAIDGAGAFISVLNTLAAMVAFGELFTRIKQPGLALVALGMAGVMVVFARVVKSKVLSPAAVIQAVGLVVLAVPLYFEHGAVTLGWGVLALGLAVYDRVRNSWIARGWMVGVLVLLTGQILFVDSMDTVLQKALFTVDLPGAGAAAPMRGRVVTEWMLMAWGAAGLTLLLGWLTRSRDLKTAEGGLAVRGAVWATIACLVAGTILVGVSAVWSLDPHAPATLAALVWVFAVLLFCRLRSLQETEPSIEALGALVLMVLSVKWAVVDGFVTALMEPAASGGSWPFLNLFFLSGILLACSVPLARSVREAGPAFYGWWITAIAFIGMNIEVLRAVDDFAGGGAARAAVGTLHGLDPWIIKCVALSVLWGLWGLATVLAGLTKNAPHVRWVGLVILGVTVAKVLLVDTASADLLLRVLSFMVVGAVLLVVSYAYHRMAEQEAGTEGAGVGVH